MNKRKKIYTYLETKDETKITQNKEPKIKKKWENKTSENDSGEKNIGYRLMGKTKNKTRCSSGEKAQLN